MRGELPVPALLERPPAPLEGEHLVVRDAREAQPRIRGGADLHLVAVSHVVDDLDARPGELAVGHLAVPPLALGADPARGVADADAASAGEARARGEVDDAGVARDPVVRHEEVLGAQRHRCAGLDGLGAAGAALEQGRALRGTGVAASPGSAGVAPCPGSTHAERLAAASDMHVKPLSDGAACS